MIRKLRFLLYFTFLITMGCMVNSGFYGIDSEENKIDFEVYYQHKTQLIDKEYKVIKTQIEMDSIYRSIHKAMSGNRLTPIPTLSDTETYIVIKPVLKTTNDIEVSGVFYNDRKLLIKTNSINNQEYRTNDFSSPNIVIRLQDLLLIDNIKINY